MQKKLCLDQLIAISTDKSRRIKKIILLPFRPEYVIPTNKILIFICDKRKATIQNFIVSLEAEMDLRCRLAFSETFINYILTPRYLISFSYHGKVKGFF